MACWAKPECQHQERRFDVFSRINIVPADILTAQKIFCIFNRSRPMGRDFFDVVFLLGKSGVNFDYLDRKMSIRNRHCES
jgi:hypothetical protein